MQRMSDEQAMAFLIERPRTAKLATVRADGRPHVAPVWFALDGDAIRLTTWHTRVKAANLLRAGQAAVCVDDEQPPFAFVILEGTAVLDPDPAALALWAERIATRYMGSQQGPAYGRRNSVPGEYLFRFQIEKIIAQTGISDW